MYESPPPAENPRRRAINRLIALLFLVAIVMMLAIPYFTY